MKSARNTRRPARWMWLKLGVCVAVVVATTTAAHAIRAQRWAHTTEADFETGEVENAVVTNLGDIKLANGSEEIGKFPEQATIIYDVQPMEDGTLYIAAGPEARLLKRDGDNVETVLELEGEQVFTLDLFNDQLLLGLSGAKARLAVLEGEELTDLVHFEPDQYIWDVLTDGQDIYVATGAQGVLYKVTVPADLEEPIVVPGAKEEMQEGELEEDVTEDATDEAGEEEAGEDAAAAAAEPADADADAAMDADAAADSEAAPDAETTPAAPTQAAVTDATDAQADAADADSDAADDDDEAETVEVEMPEGVVKLLDSKQANLLCLARDGEGHIYVGTDSEGLIYRVAVNDTGETSVFVVYDAAEAEIGALLVAEDGTVYAGTASADQARPGRLAAAQTVEQGRPAAPATADVPEPGDIPQVPDRPEEVGEGMPEGSQPAAGDGDAAATDPAAGAPASTEQNMPTESADADADQGDAGAGQTGVEIPGDAAPAAQPEPTAEQRDALREEIRARLVAARESGALQVGPSTGASMSGPRGRTPAGRPRAAAGAAAAPKEGNAVYRISPDGFVREVFRESVMILNLLLDGDKLYIATGNEGQIFLVDEAAEETTIVVDLEPQQVPILLRGPGGDILAGTANPATLVRITDRYAPAGLYTSTALDAAQVSKWGKLFVTAAIPQGASVEVQTRSGNVADPEQAQWSDWAAPATLEHDEAISIATPRQVTVESPPARFLQYRLTLHPDEAGDVTPVVDRVQMAYVVPNLKPAIQSIVATYQGAQAGGRPGGNRGGDADDISKQTMLNIVWQAADANNDTLLYTLEYRLAGTDTWLALVEDESQTKYDWETRRVPDGRYILRVTATDSTDNTLDSAKQASRRSEVVTVDNTAPAFEDLTRDIIEEDGEPVVVLKGTAVDNLTAITRVHYAVDAEENWQAILPDDLIYDSTSETFTVNIRGLSPSQHVLTLRAVDELDNAVYQAAVVEIE